MAAKTIKDLPIANAIAADDELFVRKTDGGDYRITRRQLRGDLSENSGSSRLGTESGATVQQIVDRTALSVANKAAANALTTAHVESQHVIIGGDDGGVFELVTSAAAEDGGAYCGTIVHLSDSAATGYLLKRLDRTPRIDYWGAIGDATVIAASASASSQTVTASTGVFVASDAGKTIAITGAGASGANLVTIIASVVSATQITTTATVQTAVSGVRAVFGTDNTTGIRNAILANLTIEGGALHLPDRAYLINGALPIELYTKWNVTGTSRGGTSLIQAADNTPAWHFKKENAWGWSIRTMGIYWACAQPATNTAACGLYFDADTTTDAGDYNFEVDDLYFDYGFRGISVNNSAKNTIWGLRAGSIAGGRHMSGGAVNIRPSAPPGGPNIHIGNVYWQGASVVQSEYVLDFFSCQVNIQNLEVNTSSLGCKLLRATGGSNVTINEIRSEVSSYTTDKSEIITATDSNIDIRQISLKTMTINVATNFNLFRVDGSRNWLNVDILDLSFASITSGIVFVLRSNPTNGHQTSFGRINGLVGTAGVYLTDQGGSNSQATVEVRDWKVPRKTEAGDADVVFVPGESTSIQQFTTALTANRTVKLPDTAGGPSNMFFGLPLIVQRAENSPSAYTLSVVDSHNTVLATIPASSNGKIEVLLDRVPATPQALIRDKSVYTLP